LCCEHKVGPLRFKGGVTHSSASIFVCQWKNKDSGLSENQFLFWKLLRIRQALGLSQRGLAELLGNKMTDKRVSRYECERSVPTMEVVLAYARVASVSLEQIIDDDLTLEL